MKIKIINPTLFYQKRILLIIMKIFIILFCTTLFSFSPNTSFAQEKIKIEKDEMATVNQVFNIIKKQTSYSFIYPKSLFKSDLRIQLKKGEIDISELLNKSLASSNANFELSENGIILIKERLKEVKTSKIKVQQTVITGIITDTEGTPLPGVSIVVKGTSLGVSSDFDGNYTIKASKGDVLVFSYLGLKTTEITVTEKNIINVSLETDNNELDEIIVIGYGNVKKQNLTSSISKITSEAIENRPIKNMGEALAGQLAGVRVRTTSGAPGSDPQIRIRGVNTINGDSQPLVVIDGIPGRELSDISPSDMASVQVLKDASATSIYGARGANGVILIETKKGNSEIPTVNFEMTSGFSQISNTMDMMSPTEYLAYNSYYRNMRYLESGGSMTDPMASRPFRFQIPDAWYEAEGTDWFKAITRIGVFNDYKMSASQKSKRSSLFVSGGYLQDEGVIEATYFNRLNFRINGSLDVTDNITIGLNIAPSYSDKDDRGSEGKESPIHHALTNSPLTGLDEGTAELGYPAGVGQVYTNPLEVLRNTVSNTRSGRFLTSAFVDVKFLENFKFRSQYSFDYRHDDYEYFRPGNVARIQNGPTEGFVRSISWRNWSLQNTLNYTNTFNKVHSVNFLVGQSLEARDLFIAQLEATGWPLESLQTLNLATTPIEAGTDKSRSTGASLFARIMYDYKDKYLLSMSMRYDGSSRFGGNNKWGFFPAISAGWKINKESFMDNVDWVSLLKIRGSFGQSGNDRIGNYDYFARLGQSTTVYGDNIVATAFPGNLQNPNLQWETTTTRNIGIDANLFKNRIQLSIDYFSNVTEDLLFNAPVPFTTGFSNFRTNLGKIQNTGLEFDLTTVNTTGKVKWRTKLNLSTLQNKILNMGDNTKFTAENRGAFFISQVGGPVSQFLIYRTDGLLQPEDFNITVTDNPNTSSGFPKRVTYEPLVPTIENRNQIPYNVKYVDQNGDGKINADDMVPYGNNIPDLLYGITNTVSYKNLELSVLLQGQIGGDAMFLAQRQLDNGPTGGPNTMARWLRANKYNSEIRLNENPTPDLGVDMSWDGITPQPSGWGGGFNENNDDRRIYDTTYLRIRNITLSYKIPKKIKFLQGGKIYVSAENLATFSDYIGFNPEVNTPGESNNSIMNGVDYTTFPLAKTITLGLSITF